MPANINFTTFTDDITLFLNKAAANAFFQGVTISSAGLSAEGVIKKTTISNYTYTPLVDTDDVQLSLDGGNVVQVPNKTSFDELRAAFITLATDYDALIVKLKAAGIMSNS